MQQDFPKTVDIILVTTMEKRNESIPAHGLFQTESHSIFQMVYVEGSILSFGEDQGSAVVLVIQIA